MKKLFIIFAGCFATVAVQAQLVSSADIFISSGAIVTVNGELSNTGNFKSEGDLHLRKGLTNQGQMSLTGQVVMDGEGTQLIQSTNPITAGTFVMSQMGKVLLRAPLLIENQLTLGDGILENMASNPLKIADDATVLGASNRSHVQGYILKLGDDAFRFPVGDGSQLRAFSVSKPAAYDEIQVGFVNQNPTRLSSKLSLDVAELTGSNYWSVQGRSQSNPLQVSIAAEENDRQILQLRDNQWNITPSTYTNNSISSETVLKGATYFTVGTQLAEKADVGIYPNPSNGSFEVRLKGFAANENIVLDIVDVTGKAISSQEGQVKDFKTKYGLSSEVKSGSYFLRVVRPEKNQVFNQKLSINR